MKKTLLIAVAAFCFNVLTAQTNTNTTPNSNSMNNGVQVPNNVSNSFGTAYPNTTPTWTMDGTTYRANYMNGSSSRSAIYDKNGTLLSREEQMMDGTYPSVITDYYKKNYPTEKYQVWSSTDASGNKTYYTNRNSETIWFDKDGNYKSRKARSMNKK